MRVQTKTMYNSTSSISEAIKKNKGFRILTIYDCLKNGTGVNKLEVSDEFGVSIRTIQRDIDDIRAYLAEQRITGAGSFIIIFDKKSNCFYLEKEKLIFE